MEWVERLNESIRYLEEHLTEEPDYERMGQIACCSAYHFQRMFTYMAGMTLSEYIRRRKMSLAAVDLQSGEKVIDVAGKYGYRSPTAFNRAFHSVHGISPSSAQEKGVSVKSFPPITFSVTVRGASAMQYRVETREAFRIIGISAPLHQEIEKNFAAVPQLWEKAVSGGVLEQLAALMDGSPMGLLGVSACQDSGEWKYFIAAASTRDAGSFEEYVVPAASWAIFPGEGTNQSVQELERRIVTEWFPASGYEYANAPDIEVYLSPDPAHARYEVWVPVVKKRA